MITSLRIQNFKGWRDTGQMRLAPITGLFGANSSGKSSILQFLLMLKQTAESSDRLRVLNTGVSERDYVALGSFNDLLHRGAHKNQDEHLQWQFSWTLPFRFPVNFSAFEADEARTFFVEEMQFQATIVQSARNRNGKGISDAEVENFEYQFKKEETGGNYSIRMQKWKNNYPYKIVYHDADRPQVPDLPVDTHPLKCYGFTLSGFSGAINFVNPDLFLRFNQLFESLFDSLYYLGPLRANPQREYKWTGSSPSNVGKRGEYAVEALLASRGRNPDEPTFPSETMGIDVEKPVARWLKELGLIHEFKIEELGEGSSLYRIYIQQTPEAPFVSLADVGFGVSQVLPVLTLCYYVPEGSIILFEQPEIHLHPKVQADLADVFIKVSQERNLQIVLESHSEHLLSRLQRRMAEYGIEEAGISSDKVALYFCHREGAEAHLTSLNLDEYGNISNWPKDFFGDELSERFAMVEATIKRRGQETAA